MALSSASVTIIVDWSTRDACALDVTSLVTQVSSLVEAVNVYPKCGLVTVTPTVMMARTKIPTFVVSLLYYNIFFKGSTLNRILMFY